MNHGTTKGTKIAKGTKVAKGTKTLIGIVFFETFVFSWFVVRDVPTLAGMHDDARQSLGKMGETLACSELCRRGYAILARRHRTRYGEIDIIAQERDTIVFVEVKARRHDAFGSAGAAVTPWKQRRIVRMASDYLARHGLLEAPCRFDVVAIDFEGGRPRIEVYTHAFTA